MHSFCFPGGAARNAGNSSETARAAADAKLNAFPVFMRVEGAVVVIVGGGDEALAKARLLGQSSAAIRVVADEPEAGACAPGSPSNGATHVAAAYHAELISPARCWSSPPPATTRSTAASPRTRARQGIPVNAVDRPELCDFFTPAHRQPRAGLRRDRHRRRRPGAGADDPRQDRPAAVAVARARWRRSPHRFRDAAERLLPKGAARRRFWNDFFAGAPARAMEVGHADEARAGSGRTAARGSGRATGHVALVGAGPGAEDLLTLRAQRLLMEADVIVHDALVPEAVVAMGRRDAERLPVGKRKGCHSKSQAEINALLVALGREGKRVVRLKSGDPLVFGRAGEEMQALRDAGISYEVVPGVTAAFAAAADFELPLTLRGVTSSMVFTTGHDLQGRHAARLGEAGDLRRDRRRLYGPLGRRRRRRAADRGRAVARHRGRRGRERQPGQPPPLPRHAGRPAVARSARRSDRPGHDHHRRRRRRRQFRTFRAARGAQACKPAQRAAEGADA